MEKYELGRRIGQGSYGSVYRVTRKTDRKELVLKEMSVDNISDKEREAFDTEIRLLRKLEHPCIVGYEESFLDDSQTSLCIVMSYCEGGDLTRYLKNRKNQLLNEDETMHYFVQLALALEFLHTNNIVHRDLKAQNVFLTNGFIKLGDLGIAKELTGTSRFAQTCIGTPYYMGPELFKNQPYNHKSDVWSLGCVLYELATLKHPFDAQSLNGLVSKILKGTYMTPPLSVSKSIKLLIRWLLNLNPHARPEISEILTKPYVRTRVGMYVVSLLGRTSTTTAGELSSLRSQLLRLGMDDIIQRLDRDLRRNNMYLGAELSAASSGISSASGHQQDLGEAEALLLQELAERDQLLRQEDQARAKVLHDLERAVAKYSFPHLSSPSIGSYPSRSEPDVPPVAPSAHRTPVQNRAGGARPRFHGVSPANQKPSHANSPGLVVPPTRLSNASPRPVVAPPSNVVMPGRRVTAAVPTVPPQPLAYAPSSIHASPSGVNALRKPGGASSASNVASAGSRARGSPAVGGHHANPSHGGGGGGSVSSATPASRGDVAARAAALRSAAPRVPQREARQNVSANRNNANAHPSQPSRLHPRVPSSAAALPSKARSTTPPTVEEHKHIDVVENYVADYLMDLAADATEHDYRSEYRPQPNKPSSVNSVHKPIDDDGIEEESSGNLEAENIGEMDEMEDEQRIAAAKAEAEAISQQLAAAVEPNDSFNTSSPLLGPSSDGQIEEDQVDAVPEAGAEKPPGTLGVASSIEEIERALKELQAGRERLLETLLRSAGSGSGMVSSPLTGPEPARDVPPIPTGGELQSFSDLVTAEPGMGPSPRSVFEMHGHEAEVESPLPSHSYAATPIRQQQDTAHASPASSIHSNNSALKPTSKSVPQTPTAIAGGVSPSPPSSQPRTSSTSNPSSINRLALVRRERELRRRQEEEHHRELLAQERAANEEQRRVAADRSRSLFKASPEFERAAPALALKPLPQQDWGEFNARNRSVQASSQLKPSSMNKVGLPPTPPPLTATPSSVAHERDQLVSMIRSVEKERTLIQDLRTSIQLSSARLVLGRGSMSNQAKQPVQSNQPPSLLALPSSSSYSPAEIANPGSLLEQGSAWRPVPSYSQLYPTTQSSNANQLGRLVDDYVYDSVGGSNSSSGNRGSPVMSTTTSTNLNRGSNQSGSSISYGLALNQGVGISVNGGRSPSPLLMGNNNGSNNVVNEMVTNVQATPQPKAAPALLDPLPLAPAISKPSQGGSIGAPAVSGSSSGAPSAGAYRESNNKVQSAPELNPSHNDQPAGDPLRDFYILYEQCLAAFGKSRFKDGYTYLQAARLRGESEDVIVRELTSRLGAERLHHWKLLDELVFIENSS